jgi:hypothetical protein
VKAGRVVTTITTQLRLLNKTKEKNQYLKTKRKTLFFKIIVANQELILFF